MEAASEQPLSPPSLPLSFPQWSTLQRFALLTLILVCVGTLLTLATERAARNYLSGAGLFWHLVASLFWPVVLVATLTRTQLIAFGRDSWDLDTSLADQLVAAFNSAARAIPVYALAVMGLRVGQEIGTRTALFVLPLWDRTSQDRIERALDVGNLVEWLVAFAIAVTFSAWLWWPWQAFDELDPGAEPGSLPEDPDRPSRSAWTLSPIAWGIVAIALAAWICVVAVDPTLAGHFVIPLIIAGLRAHWVLLIRERHGQPSDLATLVHTLLVSAFLTGGIAALWWVALKCCQSWIVPALQSSILDLRMRLSLPLGWPVDIAMIFAMLNLFAALFGVGIWVAWTVLWMPLARMNQGLAMDGSRTLADVLREERGEAD